MEPAGSGLVASSPPGPAQADGLWGLGSGVKVQQPAGFGDGEWDQAGVFGWVLVGIGGWRRQGRGFLAQGRGGAGTDRQGDHGQGQVTDQGVFEADLAVVETELVLSDLEVLFDRPPHSGDGDQHAQGRRLRLRDVAVEERLVGGVFQVAAHE